jgi:hypothetical protein
VILTVWLGWKFVPGFRIPALVGLTWRWDAARRLRDLRRRARRQDVKASASELSELLRRIAIARFGRAACAGISGKDWLAWLQEHDPQGFDWGDEGRLLLSLPYAPPGSDAADVEQLLVLIDAAQNWIARDEPREEEGAYV